MSTNRELIEGVRLNLKLFQDRQEVGSSEHHSAALAIDQCDDILETLQELEEMIASFEGPDTDESDESIGILGYWKNDA